MGHTPQTTFPPIAVVPGPWARPTGRSRRRGSPGHPACNPSTAAFPPRHPIPTGYHGVAHDEFLHGPCRLNCLVPSALAETALSAVQLVSPLIGNNVEHTVSLNHVLRHKDLMNPQRPGSQRASLALTGPSPPSGGEGAMPRDPGLAPELVAAWFQSLPRGGRPLGASKRSAEHACATCRSVHFSNHNGNPASCHATRLSVWVAGWRGGGKRSAVGGGVVVVIAVALSRLSALVVRGVACCRVRMRAASSAAWGASWPKRARHRRQIQRRQLTRGRMDRAPTLPAYRNMVFKIPASPCESETLRE